MYRKFTLSILTLGISGLAYSQSLMYGVGVGWMIQTQSATPDIGSFTITNSFRLNLKESDNSSFSLDLPLTVGLSSANKNVEQIEPVFGRMLDAPILISFNSGAGFKKEAPKRFGFFAGAGFGYHMNEFSWLAYNAEYIRDKVNAFGPTVHTGFRVSTGKTFRHNFEIRFSYMKMIDTRKTNIFGLGGLINF